MAGVTMIRGLPARQERRFQRLTFDGPEAGVVKVAGVRALMGARESCDFLWK